MMERVNRRSLTKIKGEILPSAPNGNKEKTRRAGKKLGQQEPEKSAERLWSSVIQEIEHRVVGILQSSAKRSKV